MGCCRHVRTRGGPYTCPGGDDGCRSGRQCGLALVRRTPSHVTCPLPLSSVTRPASRSSHAARRFSSPSPTASSVAVAGAVFLVFCVSRAGARPVVPPSLLRAKTHHRLAMDTSPTGPSSFFLLYTADHSPQPSAPRVTH